MRVLVATDGSPSARVALELARALAWPAGTVLRVVQVVLAASALEGASRARDGVAAADGALRAGVAAAARALSRDGITVESDLLAGGSIGARVVEEAERIDADLVITGSRGHGPIASMLLGSVAAAVVDHAPCPVLVARRPAVTSVVFAEDGSESAFEARRLLASWPMFRGKPVRVVSVAHVTAPLLSGVAPTLVEEARRVHLEMLAEARIAHDRLAGETAEQLRVAGCAALADTREGDAATAILACAEDAKADLIVMGSRGRSGMARLLLGSVARNVLHHAHTSVLIVRRPPV